MSRVPGDKILHPLVLTSLAVLAVNDHYLKRQYANFWTGKISDAAGMIFFPVFLLSALEVAFWLSKRPWPASRRTLYLSLFATAFLFAGINLSPFCGAIYENALRAIWACLGNEFRLQAVAHVVDPSDLLALPFLTLAYWIGSGKGNSPATH